MPSTSRVFLNARNIEKSVQFYQSLGFKVTESTKDNDNRLTYATLELDGAEFRLGWIGANDDAEFREWVSTPLGAGVIVSFYSGDVNSIFKKAENAQVKIEQPLAERPYGTAFTMNDPDGYVVTFITPKDEKK